MFDPMSELTGPPTGDPLAPTGSFGGSRPHSSRPPRSGGGDAQYGQELHSITVRARQRTFYIDLKESGNGKFFKVSEKSRGGKKSTIVFDVEDLAPIIAALQEMQGKI
ncbi:MAG: hypothetical protein ABL890_04495 [Candidatus Peribacteraceae bacterium]